MFKKRLFLALAVAGLSVGTALSALNSGRIFSTAATTATAFECTGGGSESFINMPANSSTYATRNWTGDNGVAWNATDARTDQTLTGRAIALRTSTLKNTAPVAGGVGTLSFKYKRVFTGNSTLRVFVNGVQVGTDITVTSEIPATFSQAVNQPGNASIEIRNSQNRIVVDDIQWTCFAEVAAGPELQLANAAGTNVNCGELTLAYGAQSVDVYTEAVFAIKNAGTTALNVTSITLSNAVDFSIISPASTTFSIPASGSTFVVVRFDAASAGAKTSTLTINSNDTDEGACTVALTGTGLATCVAPEVVDAAIVVDSIAPTTANVSVGNLLADGYLAIVSNTAPLTAAPLDGFGYVVGDSIGGGVVAYNGSNADFTIMSLASETEYNVFVYAYNNVDCSEGPKYNTESPLTESFETPFAPCIGATETFANMPANASAYGVKTWTGDNSVAWSATDARTDQTLTGRAITLRTGTLTNTTPVTGGIGTLTFNYKRVFTGESTLKVFVNGIQYGGDITVSSDIAAVYSQSIDLDEAVTVEIRNSGNRIVVDDINWNCYEVPNRPEIQLLDESLERKACGELAFDFADVAVNTDSDYTFTISNLGAQPLVIDSLNLSDTVNYEVVSPAPLDFPVTVDSLGVVEVTVKFNSATAGSKPATLNIVSNDADEASCTVSFTANALNACLAPVVTAAGILITDVTSNSAVINVSDVVADGYIAVLSTTAPATAPENGTVYEEGGLLGDNNVVYVGTEAEFTLTGLTPETYYSLYIYAYNSADCANGPAYSAELADELETITAPCIGGETFTGMPANASSYAVRNWTGDNGLTWTATDARTDQTLTGRAIAIRTGYIENTADITGGVGTLSFTYARVFTGNSTLKVFVNDEQVGTDITVSLETPTVVTLPVNAAGPAIIRIENSGARTIVDDIAWDCYSATERPATIQTEKATIEEVKVYPNPNNGRFQVSLPKGNETAAVEVFSMGGKLVFSKKVGNNDVIDLGVAGQGMYTVKIATGNTVATKTVVVK